MHFSWESAGLGASLKCLYANAHSMGKKRDELELCSCRAVVSLGSQRHDWSAAMEGCRLFRKGRLGRRGRGVVLCAEGSRNTQSSAWGVGNELAEF